MDFTSPLSSLRSILERANPMLPQPILDSAKQLQTYFSSPSSNSSSSSSPTSVLPHLTTLLTSDRWEPLGVALVLTIHLAKSGTTTAPYLAGPRALDSSNEPLPPPPPIPIKIPIRSHHHHSPIYLLPPPPVDNNPQPHQPGTPHPHPHCHPNRHSSLIRVNRVNRVKRERQSIIQHNLKRAAPPQGDHRRHGPPLPKRGCNNSERHSRQHRGRNDVNVGPPGRHNGLEVSGNVPKRFGVYRWRGAPLRNKRRGVHLRRLGAALERHLCGFRPRQ